MRDNFHIMLVNYSLCKLCLTFVSLSSDDNDDCHVNQDYVGHNNIAFSEKNQK